MTLLSDTLALMRRQGIKAVKMGSTEISTQAPSTLVLADTYRSCFGNHGPIRLGWKTKAPDGTDRVFWWGDCTAEALDQLLADLRQDGASVEIADCRAVVDSVRHTR